MGSQPCWSAEVPWPRTTGRPGWAVIGLDTGAKPPPLGLCLSTPALGAVASACSQVSGPHGGQEGANRRELLDLEVLACLEGGQASGRQSSQPRAAVRATHAQATDRGWTTGS